MPSCLMPPLPGVTPPTTWVPYLTACTAWNVPSLPVSPCTSSFVFLSTNTLMSYLPLPRCGDDLFGCVLHSIGDDEIQSGCSQYFLPLLHVGSFEADNDGHFHSNILCGLHDTRGNDVATHDSAENID